MQEEISERKFSLGRRMCWGEKTSWSSIVMASLILSNSPAFMWAVSGKAMIEQDPSGLKAENPRNHQGWLSLIQSPHKPTTKVDNCVRRGAVLSLAWPVLFVPKVHDEMSSIWATWTDGWGSGCLFTKEIYGLEPGEGEGVLVRESWYIDHRDWCLWPWLCSIFTWAQTSVLPFTHFVTLGILPSIYEPQFLHL